MVEIGRKVYISLTGVNQWSAVDCRSGKGRNVWLPRWQVYRLQHKKQDNISQLGCQAGNPSSTWAQPPTWRVSCASWQGLAVYSSTAKLVSRQRARVGLLLHSWWRPSRSLFLW